MYLKSLTLKGFKSFADKSTLNLEPGIIAVVGPNGSGKSNISDAVLWVLGERNAKNLRGHAMEDVIFSGSTARKATGYAEVELVLDNTDGTLPVDYTDVVITRRMYRSGESEYLINGALSRRMDIIDILHDSGLGTGTHSIISQGSLDSVLQSKPEDRRALVEEAAGVLKHKQRMSKSERKLEKMAHHVERVRDVVGEVERQLGPLERKAKRAKTYFELIGQRNRANLLIAIDDLRLLQGKWDALLESESQKAQSVDEKKSKIDGFEAEVEALQEKIRVENIDAGDLSKKQRSAASAVERMDSLILMIRDRRRSALSRAEELQVQIEQSKVQKASRYTELGAMRSELATLVSDKERLDGTVREYSQLHSGKSEVLKLTEARLLEIRNLRTESERKAKELRNKQIQQQEALTNGLAHIKVIESHAVEMELQVACAASDAKEAQAAFDTAKEALDKISGQEGKARQLVASYTNTWQETREALKETEVAEQSLKAQIEALEEIEANRRTASNEAMAWVSAAAQENGREYTAVSHAIKADAEYDTVLEAVLGAVSDSLLVDGSKEAIELACGIHSNGLDGEVVLATGAALEAGIADGRRYGSLEKNGRFALVERVSVADGVKDAIEPLIAGVIVCPSTEDAIEAHSQDEVGYTFATLEGDVVYPNGVVVIGAASSDTDGTNAISQARRLDELKSSLEDAHARTAAALEAAQTAEGSLREAQQESLKLSEQLAQIKGNVSSLERQADAAAEKLNSLTRELDDLQKQKMESQKIIDETQPAMGNIEAELEALASSLQELEDEFELKSSEVDPIRAETEELSAMLSESKLEQAKLAERIAYTERVVERHSSDMSQLEAGIAESQELLRRKSLMAARLEPLISLFDTVAATARSRARAIDEQSEMARSSSAGLHAKVSEMRQQLRDMHIAYDGESAQLSEIRVEKARLEMQVQAAVSAIVDDCKTPLDIALEEPKLENRPEVEEEAFRLNRRIANLGTINPDAAEEYDALKQRYDFLASQLGDLEGATRTLRQINRMIESRIKDDFAHTFETVNRNFQEIFTSLFPGGRANLELVSPDDIENSGVEVNAQPAGKRISKMTLMSGGEKSLTALALLFALYKTRSTPFYILDEVEAALDDTNLRRLIAFINSMRDDTQLIMITHQRRTMETADILFGVSMQADGVTKVISQKLEHALKHAE